jgi:hypothetical protein
MGHWVITTKFLVRDEFERTLTSYKFHTHGGERVMEDSLVCAPRANIDARNRV